MKSHQTILIVCLLLIGLGCADESSQPRQVQASNNAKTLAELEGSPLTEEDYKNYLLERFGENQFENYLEEKILLLKAKEMNIVVDEKEIQEEIEENYHNLLTTRFAGNEQSMKLALTERGMTLEGWKKDLGQRTRRTKILDHMVKKLRKPDSEAVKNKFNQMYGEQGLTIRLRHILVSNKVVNSRFYSPSEFEAEKPLVDQQLQKLGNEILQTIKQGESFEALAQQHSDDFTASRGGDLGDAWKGRFGAPFDQAVVGLSKGQTSSLIRTDKGYHIIKINDLQPGVEYQGSAILISTAPQGSIDQRSEEDRDKEALSKAQAILQEIRQGGNFSDIAKQKSDDVATKGRGGDLGLFGRRRLGNEVSMVLDVMQPGNLSEPIKTSRGYWIVRLDAKKVDPKQDQKLVSHIFLSSQYEDVKRKKLSSTLDVMALEKAESLLQKIKTGTDFKELALLESEDAYTKKAGGEYYNYQKSSLGPEVWEAAQTMSPNEDLRVVKSDRGYHIIQVLERQQTNFEDVKNDIMIELNEQPISPGDARAMMELLKSEVRLQRFYGSAPLGTSGQPGEAPLGHPTKGAPDAGTPAPSFDATKP